MNKDVSYNMPISALGLSVRAYNALRRYGVDTVEQLLAIPEGELKEIRNLGAKSLEEILSVCQRIPQDTQIFDFQTSEDEAGKRTYMAGDGTTREDMRIIDSPLSVRARNCLTKAGYNYVSELPDIQYADIIRLENMGQKTANEILEFAKNLERILAVAETPIMLSVRQEEFVQEVESVLGLRRGRVVKAICNMQAQGIALDGESLIHRMYALEFLRDALRTKVLSILDARGEISEDALAQRLPQHLINTTILQDVLIDLEAEGLAYNDNGIILRKYMTCREFAATIRDDRRREVLLMRLQGMTLDEIGQKYHATRERARQILQKAVGERPKLYEDKYSYIFEHYDFSREDFAIAFAESPEVYNYLDLVSRVGRDEKKEIAQLLDDDRVSLKLKRKSERAIYKDYVTFNGVRILKKRSELVRFAARLFAQQKITYGDFLSKYRAWLFELGMAEERFFIHERTYENRIGGSDYVLWNQWRSFRYYNINDRDYTELLETINLQQYTDIEFSTLKLFHAFPDLMDEYDLHDEYELHNLLKKVVGGPMFKRMPTISIGNAEPEMQMLELLIEYSPIDGVSLCQKYEEVYGTRALTVQGNILPKLWEYCENGIYSIEAESLLPDAFSRMKAALTEDFYLLKDFERIYRRECPESRDTQINPYMIKSLGYRTYAGYAVKSDYSNASVYFRHLLLDRDIVDGRAFPDALTYIGAYTAELAALKAARTIFEYAPKQYINARRLESFGVGAEQIEDYCKRVLDFVQKGEYFTIQSLRKNGFSDALDDLGFDDWFYMSLLVEERSCLSYIRLGGAKLFYYGKKAVTLEVFLQYLLEQYKKIEIYDLLDLLSVEYGLSIGKDKLIEAVRHSSMYYDSIMQTVYIDYDTYYEEI